MAYIIHVTPFKKCEKLWFLQVFAGCFYLANLQANLHRNSRWDIAVVGTTALPLSLCAPPRIIF